MIVICGGQRIGKSFIGVWISNLVMNFFHNVNYPVSDNTFYDPVESIRRIGETDKQPIMIDEAGTYLNKTDWYDRVVKAMDRIIQTQGYKCNCYIFISPFGSDIAKTFRKHFDFLIYVRKKGVIITRRIEKKYGTLKDEPIKMIRMDQILVKKSDVPIDLWEEYEKFSFGMKEKLRIKSYDDLTPKVKRSRIAKSITGEKYG